MSCNVRLPQPEARSGVEQQRDTSILERSWHQAAQVWAARETRSLAAIVLVGIVLRLGMAVYLGDRVEPTPAAYDQIFYHDLALNLLAGKGFVFTQSPWAFIQVGVPTAFGSFLYPLFLGAVYLVFGPHPLAARLVQALICSIMPLQMYGLVRRVLRTSRQQAADSRQQAADSYRSTDGETFGRQQRTEGGRAENAGCSSDSMAAAHQRAGTVALVAAAITAGYAYFVYFGATLMTDGLYLLAVLWSLILTLDLAEAPSARRWAGWGLAVGLGILLRQVLMPMAVPLFLYVLWRARRQVKLPDLALVGVILAVLILPWTVRNYRVFHRFLLLNSQAGQTLWNANHPDLGTHFESAMFPIPADLQGASEPELDSALLRRALQNIAADPRRFLLLSLDRLRIFFIFYPMAESSTFSNVARTVSFGLFLPFMVVGLVVSLREWRRWVLLYGFIVAYTFLHVISWVQIRYRMPVDVALVPFAALAVVALLSALRRRMPGTGSVR